MSLHVGSPKLLRFNQSKTHTNITPTVRTIKQKFSNINDDKIANFTAKISQKIRNLRKSKDVSQLDLALKIGIKSAEFYSNCKNNRCDKYFNLEHIYKISKALGVDIKEIFEL